MTASGLEFELKLTLLSDDPLPALEAALGPPARTVEQLNRYFLPAAPEGTMVRVREEGGGLELTVKGKRIDRVAGMDRHTDGSASGVFVRPEINRPIPPEWLFELLDTGTCPALLAVEELGGVTAPLRPAGQLYNTRRSFPYKQCTIDIDRTEFPDGTVTWELELESPDAESVAAEIAAHLSSLGIRHEPSRTGKFSRLMAMKRQRGD